MKMDGSTRLFAWFAAAVVALEAPIAAAEETAPSVRGVGAAAIAARPGPDPRIMAARARTATLDMAGETVQDELLRARQRTDAVRAACLDEMLEAGAREISEAPRQQSIEALPTLGGLNGHAQHALGCDRLVRGGCGHPASPP